MPGEVEAKIQKFEDKITFEMRPQMDFVAKRRDVIYEEIAEYLKLKHTLEMLKKEKMKKFTTRIDIGCNIFVQAEVEEDLKTQKVMVALSKDFFVELSWDEALSYIAKKEEALNKRADHLTKKLNEIRAHIVFIQEAIRELMGFHSEETKKERQMM